MTAYKYTIVGVVDNASRTDPDVLIHTAPYVIPGEVSGGSYGWPWRDTISEVTDDFANTDFLAAEGWVRVSYPALAGGPLSVYLPSVRPDFAEYPYNVQIWNYAFTAFRGLDAPLHYTTLVIASGLANSEAIPPPPDPENPDPITIQLKRDNTISLYSVKPADASVLPKYGGPVKFIRAKFATTRVAVITETITGGFMIYEEASLGVATGPVYIYSGKRKLLDIVDVSVIDQYRLYTF